MIKICFIGTPNYAAIILQALLDDPQIEVKAVISQPDKPVGRKQKIQPTQVKKVLLKYKKNIPLYQPHNIKEVPKDKLKQMSLDFIIVAAYGQILPKDILDITTPINLHASILPQHRGASPITQSILDNDKYVGVSSMLMNEYLDQGDILDIDSIKMPKDIFAQELYKILSHLAAKLCIKTLKNFSHITPIKQDESKSSYCTKIKKEDGIVDLVDAKQIYNKFKAYFDWPKIRLKNGLMLKNIDYGSQTIVKKEGTIDEISNKGAKIVCQKGCLYIKEVQIPSKNTIHIQDYIRNKGLKAGDNIL